MNFLTQRVRPDKALARLSERVVAALIFIKRPGLLSHDATTGYRFAVTRWRSEVNSNPRYRPVCRFGGLSPRLSGSGRVASLGLRDRSGRKAGDWRWLRTPQST